MRTIRFLACALIATVAFAACTEDVETPKYKITVTAGENGSAASDVTEAEAGDAVTLTAVPDEGYLFGSWKVESGDVIISDATANPLEIIMPAGDIAVSASFVEEIVLHAITVTQSENGTITVADDLKEAAAGTSVTVTATPEAGFDIVAWTITGVEIPEENLADYSVTFTMPDAEVTVTAEFKEIVDVLKETQAYLVEKLGEDGNELWTSDMQPYFENCMNNDLNVYNPITETEEQQPKWDTNGDGILSDKEAAAVKILDFSLCDGYMQTLSFIKYFTGLEILACNSNFSALQGYGEEIDFSQNTKLKYIDLKDIYLDVSPVVWGDKPELEVLNISWSWAYELDLSKCPKLRYLNIKGTDLEEIDITGIEATSGWEFEFDNSGQKVILRADQEEAFKATYPDQEYEVKG